jgi:hypothetical protein
VSRGRSAGDGNFANTKPSAELIDDYVKGKLLSELRAEHSDLGEDPDERPLFYCSIFLFMVRFFSGFGRTTNKRGAPKKIYIAPI